MPESVSSKCDTIGDGSERVLGSNLGTLGSAEASVRDVRREARTVTCRGSSNRLFSHTFPDRVARALERRIVRRKRRGKRPGSMCGASLTRVRPAVAEHACEASGASERPREAGGTSVIHAPSLCDPARNRGLPMGPPRSRFSSARVRPSGRRERRAKPSPVSVRLRPPLPTLRSRPTRGSPRRHPWRSRARRRRRAYARSCRK